MPQINVVLYQEENGSVPLLKWLDRLRKKPRAKVLVRIERLKELGSQLRRPEADYLRDGIYEFPLSLRGTRHRVLYFFHGRTVALVSHCLVRERQVPSKALEAAVHCKDQFEADVQAHTYTRFIMPKKNGRTRKRTADAVSILQRRHFARKGDRLAILEEERADAEVARKVCALRKKAGLSQGELARRAGATASAISRLEAADYEGHSLAMLRRIAAALDKSVDIRFVSSRRGAHSA
jgi:ribosome-binding protein aMBF1 (putative translation factor)